MFGTTPQYINTSFIQRSVPPYIQNAWLCSKWQRFGTQATPAVIDLQVQNARHMTTQHSPAKPHNKLASNAWAPQRHTPVPVTNFKKIINIKITKKSLSWRHGRGSPLSGEVYQSAAPWSLSPRGLVFRLLHEGKQDSQLVINVQVLVLPLAIHSSSACNTCNTFKQSTPVH